MPTAGDWKDGPAMLALPNDRWRDFCRMYVRRGRMGAGDALVRAAGFGVNSGVGRRVQAHRLMHDPRMQAAIIEETQRWMATAAPLAAHRIVAALSEEDTGVALKAANMIFDRVGLHAVSEQRQTVEHRADPEVFREIAALAMALGIEPRRLLGNRVEGVMIEGEAVEVGDDRG